ncbi:MAG TPA: protein phosphatase 2C domain-containing protein, partial [Kofleriaceae bacterium]|nr:protein phosphatase 2C domain-containing protein [Kofleriaceae bacterium]
MSCSNRVPRVKAVAVMGASHLRAARNGQDAAASWSHGELAVAVVCDGCGSSERSELGAQLVARRMCAAVARRLRAGGSVADPALWGACRDEVVDELGHLARSFWVAPEATPKATPEDWPATLATTTATKPATTPATLPRALPGGALPELAQSLLCTVLVAALDERDAAIWALGDGAFVLGDELTVLGPFPDNAPPYLAYDLVGAPPVARLEVRA